MLYCQQLIVYAKLNFMHWVNYNYYLVSFVNVWEANNDRNDIPNFCNAQLVSIPHLNIELLYVKNHLCINSQPLERIRWN
jgi:hypothetical protein